MWPAETTADSTLSQNKGTILILLLYDAVACCFYFYCTTSLYNHTFLNLSVQEVFSHGPRGIEHSLVDGVEVESREEAVKESKGQHGDDIPPGVFQRPASVGHTILFRLSSRQPVLVSSAIDLDKEGEGRTTIQSGKRRCLLV